ncbi:MAG: peroxidase family protein [Actinomycetota bacterium]
MALLVPLVAPMQMGANAAPIGQGFELNAADLRFILQQIKIAEHHVANTTAETGPCGALIGSNPNQIPAGGVGVTLPWGLRTVDGSCNNIVANQSRFGTSDERFPRLAPAEWRANYPKTPASPAPIQDRSPRVISNLIVDQSVRNPAAVEVAGPAAVPDAEGNLVILNSAPDGGLSAPYNSWFTLFGQFFDHGLDLVSKNSAYGTVMIRLNPDDPLYNQGPNVMFLTRAVKDANGDSPNQTTSWVDQSQTYASNASHQVFLRDYVLTAGRPVATGHLIEGPGNGMADWARVKQQAREVLGIALADTDVFDIPMVVADAYGNFVPGPNGFPQLVQTNGTLMEGNPAAPISTATAQRIGHAFLDDIAHHAAPGGGKTADVDTVPNPPFSSNTVYDNELLDRHFIAGDGRVNENIGLTAVHHIFHSEHNRLADEIKLQLEQSGEFTAAELAEWQTANPASGFDYFERLFQAARFVTEMQYQHLAFEEFARKVQPMVNLFGEGGTGYHTDLDPRIVAEFAHAVYRFGHSMLNETVDRTTPEGVTDNMLLLDAFLNPVSYFDGETDAGQAAGNIIRGMTRQVGNEIDEFVTEALRNDLVGLPLDLAALNIARGRESGVPTLNSFRRTIFTRTGDSGLAPYASWNDFGTGLRNIASLPNFIAAYGTHPTITGTTTVAGKRAAAQALLDAAANPVFLSDEPTAEEQQAFNAHINAVAFLESAPGTAYASLASGATTTGVDAIDLWMGGIAERQQVFGGLLGSTFNFVFEYQMESLQDGDRFYYLSRTAGLNLLTQLEGNSFAELIMRNTDVEGLPADSFSTPAYVFDLSKQNASGPIVDDPATEYDERTLLIREANGTIRYLGAEHVVWNGSERADRARSSEGDDTFRGNVGNDVYEGGDGNDHIIGGEGEDIITDLFGDEMIKGGPGNDTISSGRGFGGDLVLAGSGHDFVIGGNDATETIAGPGNDFIFAGDDLDTVFGDEGDDWMEGGRGPFALLQGDSGAPFQDDPNEFGHDVLFGWGGEQDYDAEGGDDIMFAGPGIQRAEGMRGFDWVTHRGDPVAGDADMSFTGLLAPAVDTNRDRFDMVEGLSGWFRNDVLRGDNGNSVTMVGHELDRAGIDRISGLREVLDGVPGRRGNRFTGGNIILGGSGSDIIEGRGGDDVIDGDRWLDAQLRTPTNTVDNLLPLRSRVLSGQLNPGDIQIVRSIKVTPFDTAIDTAVYSDVRANYDIRHLGNGVVIVEHVGGTLADGLDTLKNIEVLRFAPTPGDVSSSNSVSLPNVFNFPAEGLVTITNTSRTDVDNVSPTENDVLSAAVTVVDRRGPLTSPITLVWQVLTGGGWVSVGNGTTLTLGDAHVGLPVRAVATFSDAQGTNTQFDSFETAAVVNVDDPTTGGPVLSDLAPTVGYELSVDLSSIADDDGLPAVLGVQWLANGVAIPGATSTVFTPQQAQVGRTLSVQVSFTDLHGTPVQLLSGSTAPVTVPMPAITLSATTLNLGSRATGATPGTAQVLIGNTGRGDLVIGSITLTGANAAVFSLQHTCSVILPGQSCGVGVSMLTTGALGLRQATIVVASNDPGGNRNVAVSGTLVANTPATGAPTIDDTTPIEGQVLTASPAGIVDANGMANATFTYRWQQTTSPASNNFVDIAGATSGTLSLTQAQVNRRVRVIVGFVDDAGSNESRTSAATELVGDVFIGTDATEVWDGTGSDDQAFGNGGNDLLRSRGGADLLRGDGGDDNVQGGDGDDVVLFDGVGAGVDFIDGGAGNDRIEAQSTGTVIGLRTLSAIESILSGGFAGVIIRSSAFADTLNFTSVTLSGIERIEAGDGNDTITGSLLADWILGQAGGDTLAGGAGDDVISGGIGPDLITPGAGNDVLVMVPGDGTDRVNGFDAGPPGGQDLIDLRGFGITAASFGTRVTIINSAGSAQVTISTPGQPLVRVTLLGTPVAAIDMTDFIVG